MKKMVFRWVSKFRKMNVFLFDSIDIQNDARCVVGNNGSISVYI